MFTFPRVRATIAVLVIGWAFLHGIRALHTAEGIQGALNDPPLDPARFRPGIVAVEARLHAPGPLSVEDRIRLSKAFHDLSMTVERDGATRLARHGAREMRTLAGMCQGLGKLGDDRLEYIRTGWHRVRANTFDDAWWYRWSESDPVASPEPEPVATGN